MSFSKLSYDKCAYEKSIAESMQPGQYMLHTPCADCNNKNCFIADPSVANNNTGVAVSKHYPLVDVSSELLGITRKLSECPLKRQVDNSYAVNNQLNVCNAFVNSEDTKISNPPCTLRGTGWNRFDFLHEDPQSTAITPFPTEINNRLLVKDNHRPCLPTPMQHSVLPNSVDDTCYTDYPERNVFKYDDKKEVPFIHWRPCDEIDAL